MRSFFFKEMEEIKTELKLARTHSARLREEVRMMRTGLEREQQNHKKTSKELEELRSLHETLIEKSKDDKESMETRIQELEATVKQLEEDVLAEKSEKEVFIEETERLRNLCDKLDEAKSQTMNDLRSLQGILDKTSKENTELAKKLLECNKNILNETIFRDTSVRLISLQGETVADKIAIGNPPSTHFSLIEDTDMEIKTKFIRNDSFSAELLDETRKDLAKVSNEREEARKRCEELEKQLEETLASLKRQRTASLHDRATSPGEPDEFEFEGKFECIFSRHFSALERVR